MVLDFAPSHWSSGLRLVALAMADRVNGDTQECWPSVADLARRTGLKPRMVQTYLRQLEFEGVVTNLGQRKNKDGTPGSNVWRWNLLITLDGGVQRIAGGGVQSVAPSPSVGVQRIAPEPLLLTSINEPLPRPRLKRVDNS